VFVSVAYVRNSNFIQKYGSVKNRSVQNLDNKDNFR
jgi:hypothetical protein